MSVKIIATKKVNNIQFLYLFFYVLMLFFLDKPANKNQVLFEKNFFLKKSITNKPAFFIWFNKTDMSLFLLIYFHYSGIVYSQKFIKSCDLCNLTWLSFFHFLLNEVINSIVFWFQSSHTSHCFKSNFS